MRGGDACSARFRAQHLRPGPAREREAARCCPAFTRGRIAGSGAVLGDVAEANAVKFLAALRSRPGVPRVLVVGGGVLGSGADALYSGMDIEIVGLDVYPSPYTHLIADAHQLPFASETFDGVWIRLFWSTFWILRRWSRRFSAFCARRGLSIPRSPSCSRFTRARTISPVSRAAASAGSSASSIRSMPAWWAAQVPLRSGRYATYSAPSGWNVRGWLYPCSGFASSIAGRGRGPMRTPRPAPLLLWIQV